MSSIPELLYHTTLTVVESQPDRPNNMQTVYVLGTHGNLVAAKQFAANALHTLGYEPGDFAVFEGHQPGKHWRHGDGVVVYAKAFNGYKLLIGLKTTPNAPGFAAQDNGKIDLPSSAGGHLHYVIQTTIDYSRDRSGAAQTSEIEGCFLRRDEAVRAAKDCLIQALGAREEFAQYDEKADLRPVEDWPFGEDVLVHAVAQTGENYTVAVRTPPEAHKAHAKHTKHRSEDEVNTQSKAAAEERPSATVVNTCA